MNEAYEMQRKYGEDDKQLAERTGVAEPLRGTPDCVGWIVIKPFTVDDARHAAAGILLSWLARVEMRTSDDSMRILPAADWRTGPEEFVKWLSERGYE